MLCLGTSRTQAKDCHEDDGEGSKHGDATCVCSCWTRVGSSHDQGG
jgi:hypothetical protein